MSALGGVKVPKFFCLLWLDESAVVLVDDIDAGSGLARSSSR